MVPLGIEAEHAIEIRHSSPAKRAWFVKASRMGRTPFRDAHFGMEAHCAGLGRRFTGPAVVLASVEGGDLGDFPGLPN